MSFHPPIQSSFDPDPGDFYHFKYNLGMKQFYSLLMFSGVKTTTLLFAFLMSTFELHAQVYTAVLSGPAESPPNNSPGTGLAKVTLTGTSMRVQSTFSGLLSNVSISHIHAPTTNPLTGTAGVATPLPSFPGFPAGVTSGTYDMTFDMTLASSYNPAYITANGGTPASAFIAFKSALDNNKAYWNIHTTMFPGGEIRGFLVLCPAINVTIPNAMALPSGVLPNTVYPAYSPASSLTLTTNVSGGTGSYSYSWSTGSTASGIMVSPTATTTYTVNVMDMTGCPGTASKTVSVMDIAGGKNGDKIEICHKNGQSLTIGSSGVADHLAHGDMLGTCAGNGAVTRRGVTYEEGYQCGTVKVLRNPTYSYFDIQLSNFENNVQVRVFDVSGRLVETHSALPGDKVVRIGSSYRPGIYLAEVMQGEERQTLRLLKN